MEVHSVSKATELEPRALPGPKVQLTKPRVFIISDVRLYRDGLSLSLAHDGSLQVLGAAAPSALTIETMEAQASDAIIIDIKMRGGLQLARELHLRLPHIKIVAFAVSDIDDEIITGAMAGISGYVQCDAAIGDLVAEVLNSVRGELHCSPRLAARLLQQVASLSLAYGGSGSECGVANQEARLLTRRESEILALIDKGWSNKEIARSLNISFATVKNHVHHILDKLQVRRRGQALARLRERRT